MREDEVSVREWRIYRGTGEPHDGIGRLPDPPPWRAFPGVVPEEAQAPVVDRDIERRLGRHAQRAAQFRPEDPDVVAVNAALYLRRPLLVTGRPGTGKSTLAYSVAHELGLGRVLRWPVYSRSRLEDGLYAYDAIGRLQDAELAARSGGEAAGIGRYLRLGPLGTALLPSRLPRVVLIDELDKGDIDLPNDLLNVLEEGAFTMRELERLALTEPEIEVLTDDPGRVAVIEEGRVSCAAFPFVVITSNGDREFPPALMRRCIRLEMGPPSPERLAGLIRSHLGDRAETEGAELIRDFLVRRDTESLAADQLLNAIFLTQETAGSATPAQLAERVMQPLDRQR